MISAYYYSRKALTDKTLVLSTPFTLNPASAPIILQAANTTSPLLTKSFSTILIPSIVIMVIVAVTYYVVGWYGIRRSHFVLMLCFLAIMGGDIGAVLYAIYAVFSDAQYALTKNSLAMFCKFFFNLFYFLSIFRFSPCINILFAPLHFARLYSTFFKYCYMGGRTYVHERFQKRTKNAFGNKKIRCSG